jgi:hypothetical protein
MPAKFNAAGEPASPRIAAENFACWLALFNAQITVV